MQIALLVEVQCVDPRVFFTITALTLVNQCTVLPIKVQTGLGALPRTSLALLRYFKH
jgi:hypothetical protein